MIHAVWEVIWTSFHLPIHLIAFGVVIQVSLLNYEMIIQEPYQCFTVRLLGVQDTCLLAPGQCRSQKEARRVQLPFGLQKFRRLRKHKNRKTGNRKRHVPTLFSSVRAEAIQAKTASSSFAASSSASSSTSSDTSSFDYQSSSSESSSSSSSSSSNDSDDDGGLAEEVSMPDPAFISEEAAVTVAHQEQQGLEQIRRAVASTFFGDLGLTEVGIAASGRSVCGVCNQAIQKNLPRFAYAWSRGRPSKWMHASCFAAWSHEHADLKQQAAQFLMNNLDVSSEDLKPVIMEALQVLHYTFPEDWIADVACHAMPCQS